MTFDASFLLLNLRLVGVAMAGLVILNIFVPHRFRWREDLSRVSLLNRQIFEVHAIFLVVTLALFSALLLTSADALLEPTRLSRAILIGLTIFWGLRLVAQWFYYSPAIWRGQRFFTVMHVLFSALWIYVTGVFGTALWFVTARG
jgi:hypothetical protein